MTKCVRPGCTGSYDADGYCDECGMKAPAGASGLSAPTGAGLGGATSGRGTSARTGRSRSTGRGRLGAGMVTVPPVPLRDPSTAILSDPAVPESQRFCAKCGEPVGRGRDGKPGRAEGFCPRDRTPFNFRPRLKPGELVDRRYEILGALAHGGLGWIYLARDRNISESGADRWVVLKGLINAGDPDAMEAAVAERRFLVEVDHPNIVKIHDFARHPDPATGDLVGYIVMEYVGGRSLKDLALAHLGPDGRRAPLPLPQVLAYGLEILPALGYLHDRGLLFCDFKPDNVIHAEEQLKLIDLGAVRRVDDQVSALYGTHGYQVPEKELIDLGPSIGSDLYTVARTLAVLSFDFSGFSTRYQSSLPSPADVPLLAAEESYHRLLLRGTDLDPDRRFPSAGDMADQVLGVLREVLSAADGVPRPAVSTLFTPERRAFGTLAGPLDPATVARSLPLPLVDPADPGAAFLATLSSADPTAAITALRNAPVLSLEVVLQLVRARVDAGDPAGAAKDLASVANEAPGDWRLDWYGGLVALASGQPAEARDAFDRVYSALPGEAAVRLALAAGCELAGDRDGAARRYTRVWRVDHGYVSAAFGLARQLLAAGDRNAAVAVLDEVPDSSSEHVAAQIAAVRARLFPGSGPLTEADLVDASRRIERLRLDSQRNAGLAVEVFRTALEWLGATVPPVPRQGVVGQVLGRPLSEREVRFGLEHAYRLLAGLETDPMSRYALVDQANAVRPRTVV